jgi:hypothetical protein
MEPLNDEELNQLLSEWHAPSVPEGVAPLPKSPTLGWQWLWKGSVRTPVPVAMAVVIALVWLALFALQRPVVPDKEFVSNLSDFRPARVVQIRLIRGDNEQN